MKFDGCLQVLIVQAHADVFIRCGEDSQSALHVASLSGSLECVRILVQDGGSQVNEKCAVGYAL
jgi:ankyrin repeat protein